MYEQAISPAGWSLPSHASMFTGLYASGHGADDQHKYLQPEFRTLAEIVRSRGYQTLGYCDNPYVGPATGLDRGFEWFNRVYQSSSRPILKRGQRLARKIQNGTARLTHTLDSGAGISMRRRLPRWGG